MVVSHNGGFEKFERFQTNIRLLQDMVGSTWTETSVRLHHLPLQNQWSVFPQRVFILFFFFTSSALLQVQTAKPFKRGEISLSVRATSGAVNLLLLGTTRHARALPAY